MGAARLSSPHLHNLVSVSQHHADRAALAEHTAALAVAQRGPNPSRDPTRPSSREHAVEAVAPHNMVRLLADPALSPSAAASHETAEGWSEDVASPDEHTPQRNRDLAAKRGLVRPPRRGWSMTDYQADRQFHGAASHVELQAPIPEHGVLAWPAAAPRTDMTVQMARRPKLPPPRRSYSATDKEPEPVARPRPGCRMTMLDLPSELHYTLYDYLDPIDGVCLGLAHSRLYAIHRRKYGRVPLCSRYSGPNDMEWAWRGAGPLIRPELEPRADDATAASGDGGGGLHRLRVKGQVYCRKCGISRCELHRHLREWMGDGYEYCEVKKLYGRPATTDARPYCFRSSPTNPQRCGRHGGRKTG